MSITTPLQPEDNGAVSRVKLNDNFTALETAFEEVVLDGAPLATTTVKGRVKLSVAPVDADEPEAVGVNDTARVKTANEQAALAGGGAFGTPSASNKFLTEAKLTDEKLLKTIAVVTFTSSGTWTKNAGLKYVVVEGVGGGVDGLSGTPNEGGGAGGYFRKLIPASALGATETVTIAPTKSHSAGSGGVTSFGSHASGNSGTGATGGTATGGDINITGQRGQGGSTGTGGNYPVGGSSLLGLSGQGNNSSATGFGAGGTGSGTGTPGVIIVTEYYA